MATLFPCLQLCLPHILKLCQWRPNLFDLVEYKTLHQASGKFHSVQSNRMTGLFITPQMFFSSFFECSNLDIPTKQSKKQAKPLNIFLSAEYVPSAF